MNQAIRNTWMVAVALFLVLIVAISVIQVFLVDTLRANDFNSRQIFQEFGSARGPILVDGQPIAESVESDDDFDYQRVYNDGPLYSGLTGFYSLTYGATGLEEEMNHYLSGSSDGQFINRITEVITDTPMQGAQVELTIDQQMQELAYSVLPEDQQASAVISDPQTGEVLAMASRPGYDPNLLAVHSGTQARENMEELASVPGLSPYVNRPTDSTPSPGSTFKLIDIVAMLESGQYEPDQVLPVPDRIPLPQTDVTLGNFAGGACGQRDEATLEWIFAQSCNTPFALAAMELGQERLLTTAENFGFNQSFEIPLNVTASNFPDEEIPDATLAQSVLGQVDVQSTALQMNMAAAAIANDGTMMRPELIDTVRGADLSLLEDPQPEVFQRTTSPEVAEQVTQMMRQAVQNGTAVSSRSETVDIAAKTGTAQIGDSGRVHSWITGFAPADDPQVAVTLVYQDIDYETGHQLTVTNLNRIMEAVVTQ